MQEARLVRYQWTCIASPVLRLRGTANIAINCEAGKPKIRTSSTRWRKDHRMPVCLPCAMHVPSCAQRQRTCDAVWPLFNQCGAALHCRVLCGITHLRSLTDDCFSTPWEGASCIVFRLEGQQGMHCTTYDVAHNLSRTPWTCLERVVGPE